MHCILNATMGYVLKMLDFILETVDFILKMTDCLLTMMDYPLLCPAQHARGWEHAITDRRPRSVAG